MWSKMLAALIQSVSYNQNQGLPRYSADTGLTLSTDQVDQVAMALQKTQMPL